ncbi:glycosyltransferase family 4 protein [Nonomuraea aurantiaca]|uniref:glycosyltransferase family 4 protein n=1 Tax=Nonomuraea aurantiaca TaxID=2878562 RepID=UPI001CD9E0AE|nr:glycosyltransferase family 4 protein [Nonomuraea aurantiaca]MCA2229192.1 glycosyltransferase family 4 protein [Nonomuraea aurantiaca]
MRPVSVTLVVSSPWTRDLRADDGDLRSARALAERLGGPYSVIVPSGAAEPGFTELGAVHLYRVPDLSRPAFLRAARHTIDHGLPRFCDVLLSSDPLAAVAVELSRTRTRTPHIVQIQGDVLDPGPAYGGVVKRAGLALVSRAAVRRATAVRAVRQGIKRRAEQWTRRPVAYIPSRVDTRFFAPSAAPGLRPIHAVMVGNLLPVKNHASVIRAWPHVVDRVPGARLVVLGEGSERPRLQSLINDLGVGDHVELRGSVPRDEVVRTFGQARLAVHPSWSEGQPRAVLEAMSCGLPMLCSDIPAHREIIRPETGALLTPGDVRGWAESIVSLLADPERAWSTGAAGRRYVAEHHDFDVMIDMFAGFIRDIAMSAGTDR